LHAPSHAPHLVAQQEAAMEYVRIGIMEMKGSIDELNELARHGALPMFRRMQGFISYEFIPTGDGKAISISRWRTREAAEQGARSAAEFVRDKASHAVTILSSYVGPATVQGSIRDDMRPSAPSYPS